MAYELLQGLCESRAEHSSDGVGNMAFMFGGVRTGFMAGLNAGEIDVGFGSVEDVTDRFSWLNVAT